MTTSVTRKIGMVFCFTSILFLGVNQLQADDFGKCHKKFVKQNKKCESLVKKMGKLQKDMDKLTAGVRKLIEKKNKVNESEMSEKKKTKALKKIKKQVESKINKKQSKSDLFVATIENYDQCKDAAQKALIGCRVDKKSFKTGCNESKLDKKLKAIYESEDGVQEEFGNCLDGCIEKHFGDRETFKLVVEEVTNKDQKKGILVMELNKYDKCSTGCYRTFAGSKKNREAAKAERLKIYKKCLNVSELD